LNPEPKEEGAATKALLLVAGLCWPKADGVVAGAEDPKLPNPVVEG
jgi:hypothetical protein